LGVDIIHASICNNEATVRLLLQEGTNVEAQTQYGEPSVVFAVANGYMETVRILFEIGKADVTWESNDGTTSLDIAVRKGHDQLH